MARNIAIGSRKEFDMSRWMVLLIGLLATCLTLSTRADVTLISKGQARAVLVVPMDAIPDETIAAEEIQSHLEKKIGRAHV